MTKNTKKLSKTQLNFIYWMDVVIVLIGLVILLSDISESHYFGATGGMFMIIAGSVNVWLVKTRKT
jgi:hypothetical protein